MALVDTTWYTSSVKYAAITARPQNAAVAAGVLARQFTAPAVNNERAFVAIVAGTTANVTDATWVLTRGAKTTDGTVTWQEVTGQPAVNGDLASTATWAQVKAVTPAVLGQVIKRSNNASYQICTTAGAMSASEPAFSDTAGTTTTDTTAVWTSLGPVANFPAWGAPHARLAAAYATNWGAAGHKFFLADNHAETQTTAITLNAPSAVGVATCIVCVDRTAALPPVEANFKTGATITTTGASDIQFSMTVAGGTCHYQGIAFSSANLASSSALGIGGSGNHIHKNCAFIIGGTGSASNIGIGQYSVLWDNCTVQFGAVAQVLRVNSAVNFEWRNTPSAIQGAILPTVLFTTPTNVPLSIICRGVDFSALSTQLLVNNPQTGGASLVLEDCKLHASMTRYGTSTGAYYASMPVITVRCDS